MKLNKNPLMHVDYMFLQAPALEAWSGLQQEHCIALKETTQALESAIVRVPLAGGVKVTFKQPVAYEISKRCMIWLSQLQT